MANGITDGTSADKFSPGRNITRQEMALMIYKTAVYMGESGEISGNVDNYADHGDISSWALTSMIWCVENGYITGNG